MAAEALLICQPDLLYEVFIVVFQSVKPVLHLVDDIVFSFMIHLVQFIWSEFFAHDIRLSY